MKKLFSIAMFALCGLCGIVNGQETSKDGAAMKSMAAKKMIMAPETMAAAKKSMMGPDSMVPAMVAKEMVRQEVMQDQDVMRMTEKNSMAKPGGDKIMKNDKQASMAGDKMMADPSAMQMLFQELVARHIAARKMAMMNPANDVHGRKEREGHDDGPGGNDGSQAGDDVDRKRRDDDGARRTDSLADVGQGSHGARGKGIHDAARPQDGADDER